MARTHSKKYLSSPSSKPDAIPPWVSKVPSFVELDRKMPPPPHVQDPACFPGSLRIREVTWENLLLSMEEVRHRFPVKGEAPLPHSHCTHRETEACRCPVTLPDPAVDQGQAHGPEGTDLTESLSALHGASTEHLLGDGLWVVEPAAAVQANDAHVHLPQPVGLWQGHCGTQGTVASGPSDRGAVCRRAPILLSRKS